MHRSCGRWPGSARAAGDPTIGAFLDLDAKSLQQTVGRRRDLRDRPVERLRVAGRWLLVAADLADVLAGGGLQFARCRRLVGATEGLDASAHARRVHTGPEGRQRAGFGARSGRGRRYFLFCASWKRSRAASCACCALSKSWFARAWFPSAVASAMWAALAACVAA